MPRQQLATVGSGNHYVDWFTDEEDRVWIGVHFGSRGLGHKLATWFLQKAGAKDGMDVEPCVIPASTDLGAVYRVHAPCGCLRILRARLGVRSRCEDSWSRN